MTEECIVECIRRKDRIFKTMQSNMSNVQGKVKKGIWRKEWPLTFRLETESCGRMSEAGGQTGPGLFGYIIQL